MECHGPQWFLHFFEPFVPPSSPSSKLSFLAFLPLRLPPRFFAPSATLVVHDGPRRPRLPLLPRLPTQDPRLPRPRRPARRLPHLRVPRRRHRLRLVHPLPQA